MSILFSCPVSKSSSIIIRWSNPNNCLLNEQVWDVSLNDLISQLLFLACFETARSVAAKNIFFNLSTKKMRRLEKRKKKRRTFQG